MAQQADSGTYFDFDGERSGKRRDRVAEALLRSAMSTAPAGSWLQIPAQALQGAYGGYLDTRDRKSEADREAAIVAALTGMPGLGGDTDATGATASPAPSAPQPMTPGGPDIVSALTGGRQSSNVIDMTQGADGSYGMTAPTPAPAQPSFGGGPSGGAMAGASAAARTLGGQPVQGAPQSAPMNRMAFAPPGGLPAPQGQPQQTPQQMNAGSPLGLPTGAPPPAAAMPSGRDPASIRYNNPGAMWPGPSSKAYGATGAERIGGGNLIAQFPDAESGAAAQFDLLRRMYAGKPLARAIAQWSGGNSVGSYVRNISAATGLSPDTVLTPEMLADPRIAIPLAQAMAQHEAGRAYPMSEPQWQSAHARVYGGAAAAPAQPQQPIQVADASGRTVPQQQPPQQTPGPNTMTAQYIKTLLSNPATRAMGMQLYQQYMVPKPMTEGDQLRNEKLRLEVAEKRRELGSNDRGADSQLAAGISGGLERLSSVPNEYSQRAFETATGPWQGDPDSWAGGIARGIRDPVAQLLGSNPQEVRNRIAGDSQALAATLKPLIRKPGEGAWSDKDQAVLNSIVGNLATAKDAGEYQRALEGVRQRIIANFGIDLPPLGQRGQQQQGAPTTGTVEDGYRYRGGNPADPNSWERVN